LVHLDKATLDSLLHTVHANYTSHTKLYLHYLISTELVCESTKE